MLMRLDRSLGAIISACMLLLAYTGTQTQAMFFIQCAFNVIGVASNDLCVMCIFADDESMHLRVTNQLNRLLTGLPRLLVQRTCV